MCERWTILGRQSRQLILIFIYQQYQARATQIYSTGPEQPTIQLLYHSGNIASQHGLRLRTQTFLNEARDAASALLVRLLQVLPNPGLQVRANLGPRVLSLRADGGQRGEADAEGHVLDVVLGDEVVRSCWEGRELKEFEERFAGEAPALFVAGGEGFGVGKGFGEGDDSGLAV